MKKIKEFFKRENLNELVKKENLKNLDKKKYVMGALVIILVISIVAITNDITNSNSSKNEKEYTEMLSEVSQSYVDFVFNEKRDTVKQEIEFLKFDTDVRERLINEKFSYEGVDMSSIIQYQNDCIEANKKFIDELKKLDGKTKIDRTNLDSKYGKAYSKTVGSTLIVNNMFKEISKLEKLVVNGTITREQYNLILNSYFYS